MKYIWNNNLRLICLIALCALSLPVQSSAQVQAQSSFEPSNISVGQTGTYTIRFYNLQSAPQVDPPQVDGLRFSPNPSISQSFSNINGRSTYEISLSWRFSALRVGDYNVPDRFINLSGERVRIPGGQVKVVPMSDQMKGLFYFEWVLPEKTIYVGEAIEAELRLYIRSNISVRLGSLPSRTGDSFLQTPFPENVATYQTTRDGIEYRVGLWPVVLTPIRAGKADLEATLTVIYTDPTTGNFRRDFFGTRRYQEQEINLSTPLREIEVAEIPQSGRLPGFNGALGDFSLTSSIDPSTVKAGEPITLTVTLSGKGNFDRISAPEIPETPGWRIYPPKSNFEPIDNSTILGSKTFEYILTPQTEAIAETPAIPFASFDPKTESFHDLSITPQSVAVLPPPAGAFTSRSFVDSNVVDNNSREKERTFLLRANKPELGTLHPSLQPLFYHPRFWIAQAVCALLLLVSGLIRWRRSRLQSDDVYARRYHGSKTVRKWTKDAEQFARAGDALSFYHSAQRAIQEAVARDLSRSTKASSLTLSEIESTLQRWKIDAPTIESIQKIYTAGDALKYARIQHDASTLLPEFEKLNSTIKTLYNR